MSRSNDEAMKVIMQKIAEMVVHSQEEVKKTCPCRDCCLWRARVQKAE